MRDPERIPRLLKLLEEIWVIDPDLRLGQILEWEAQKMPRMDLFYIEDDIMEQRLKARLEVERLVRGHTA